MPSEDTKILEFNQNQKSYKAPFIIYVDLKWMIQKIDGYNNNPESLQESKWTSFISFLTSTIFSFRSIENKHDV